MPTALPIPTHIDLERNQLLRAALELVTTPDATPVVGQVQFTNVDATLFPPWSIIVRDVSQWRVLAALNVAQTVTGLWAFKAGAGGPPFTVDAANTGLVTNLNADMVDSRHAISPVPDGTSPPTAGFLPVYGTNGRLVCFDPAADYDAVNKRTLDLAVAGIRPFGTVHWASTARFNATRSGNVLTAAAVGVLVTDSGNPVAGETVLLKDQQTGGTGVDNGIYTVTNAGTASVAAVLTRHAGADETSELRIGLSVFVEKGTVNIASQWGCSQAGTINVDPNLWVKQFQQQAYAAGRGMVLAGLTFHFGLSTPYTAGSIWWNNSASTVAQVAPPSVRQFLRHPGGPVAPEWGDVSYTDISNLPNIVKGPSSSGGTALRHARWATTPSLQIEDSNLLDVGSAVTGAGNTVASAPVTLGNSTSPFGVAWLNSARIKATAGSLGLETLVGFADIANDNNTSHKEARTWTSAQVKAWLALSPADINTVPTTRTLTISGTAGLITVTPSTAQDLSADRSWLLSLDLTALDNRWMTLLTAQTATGLKTWENATGTNPLVQFRTTGAANPSLALTAAGHILFGDGTATPTGDIGFFAGRIRIQGQPVTFEATSPVAFATSVGVGIVSPSAWIEIAAGSTTRGPLRMAGTGNALLTVPLAGSIESDNNRLWFTNTVPTRRGISFLDDIDFTNDAQARNAGGVNFSAIATGNHFAISNLDGQVLALDCTIAVRMNLPGSAAITNPLRGLWALTQSTSGGYAAYDWSAYMTPSGLVFSVRDNTGGAIARSWTILPSVLGPYLNTQVDFTVVRAAGVITLYLNGQVVTPTPVGAGSNETLAVAGGTAALRFHVGGINNLSLPWTQRVQIARVFNRALTTLEIQQLARGGVEESDKWASTVATYTSNFTAGVDGWFQSGADAGNVMARDAGPIGGLTDVLKYTNGSGTSHSIGRSQNLPRMRRSEIRGKAFLPTANSLMDGALVKGYTAISGPNSSGKNAWVNFTFEARDENAAGTGSTINIFGTSAGSATFTAGSEVFYVRDIEVRQTGCLIDLDLGMAVGSRVLDWSGRYPAQLAGTFEHERPQGVTIPPGPGGGPTIVIGLRKVSQTFVVATDGTQVITHGLGTKDVAVTLWDDTGLSERVESYVSEADVNSVTVSVGKLRATPRTLRAVIVG